MAAYSKKKRWAYAFVFPQLLITLLFFIVPAIRALYQSFYFTDAFGVGKRFAALSNYTDLFVDPSYITAFQVTLIVSVCITLCTLCLGLFLAYLVAHVQKGAALYKTLLLWPYAVAPAIAAVLWRFLCQPELGWFSTAASSVGLDFNYLVNTSQALLVIIVAACWQQFSFNFLFYFSAIKAIPSEIMDASIIDGASGWRRFRTIIFPLVSPTSFFLLTMNIIYSFFETFGMIDVLTRGGPAESTTTLIYKLYQDGFDGLDISSSASQSVILMILVSLLMFFQFHFVQKKVHYQ